MTEVFRVAYTDGETSNHDTFEEAIRTIRKRYPNVSYNDVWTNWPCALNGDECAELPFGVGGESLGQLVHLKLRGE